MYLIAIAWIYVALMMAIAEATHPNGGVMGALITFVLYGVAPLALVLYLVGTPMRRRARQQQEADDASTANTAPAESAAQHDDGRHPTGDAVAPERKEA